MEQNNFWIDLVAALEKEQSKKQVQSDAKNLGDIYVPLIGKLSPKSKTKAQLKKDLSGVEIPVKLTGKVNKKGVVTSVQQATTQAQAQANKAPIQVSMNLKKDKLINDIKFFGQQNTKLFKDANMTAKYNSLLDNAKLATSAKQIQDLRMQLSAMRSEIKATNLSGLTLGDTFKKTFKRATELFTGTGGVMLLSQQLREAWTEALGLDKAYTDLIKVQNELTRGDYLEYLERCNKKAQELATTQKSLIEGATEFSKSGYTKSQSDALTEKSTILSNVGEMSASDSAEAIISGVQAYDVVDGYDDVIDKAGALIDKYNEIGNTSSITTAEIAQGVQSVGSVFADANTSVDEFIALLAAGNRQYQDADALALGLRTSALRIRGCITELELMGEETDGVAESTTKLEAKIKALTNINGNGGVKILEADGETFRSIYDIFLDISKVYKDMSDTDQSALLELISGKHRASAISATLNNMSEAQEIYQRSLESAGSAQEEYDKYLQSSEAALNRFKGSMTETYQSVLNGDTVTGILNCGNATLQFANSIGLVESTLKGLVAIGVVKAITTLSTAFKASAISASNFGTALNTVKNMSTMARDTTEYTNALQTLKVVSAGLSDVQLKQVLSSKALSDADRIAILRTTGLTKAQAQAKLAQMGLVQSTKAQTTAQNKATASTFSLTAAVKGFGASLKAAFMNNPVGIVIMGLSMAFGAVTSAIDSANQKAEEARQMAKDAASEANTLGDEVAELTAKYIALSEAVKTDASAKEDLISTQAELLKKLGLEGESIDDLIAKYGSLSNAIRQASLDSLKNSQIDLIAGVEATREELLKVGADGFWGGNNIISATGDDAVKAFKELEKAGVVDSGSFGTGGGALVLIGDDTTTEGILENYQRLEDALSALRDSNAFTAEELSDNSLYQAIYGRYSEMKDEVEAYKSSIADLNENLAQQTMLAELQGSEIPKTEEDFNSFRDELVKTAVASKQFIGNEKEITDAINGYLSTVPEFEGFYSIPLENELDKVDELLSQEVVSKIADFKDLNDSFTALTDNASLISSINKEISETGRISAENLSKMNEAFPENKYPEMTEALYKYQLGLINTSELFNVLTDCYNKDRDNYVKALVNKAENNAEVFQKIRKLNASLFETMSKDYKLDIDNWKTLAQAKANIDSQLVKELAGVWTGYYSMQRDAVTGLYGAVNKEYDVYDDSDMLTPEMEADRVKQKEVIDKYNKLIQDLNKATANIVVPDIGKLDWSGLSDFDSSSSSNSSSSSPTHFDWIENKVNNLNDELDSLNDKVNDVYSSWGKRNNALASAIDKTREAIDLQKQAYDRYMQEANSVGLSDTYASLVRNGAIDISTISDESLKEKINEYQNWYEKAQDCLKVQEDLINSLNELNSQKFNNLQSEYDSLTQTMSSQIDIIQKQIDLLEMKGKFANESYYDGMISLSQKQLNSLLSEREQLQSILNSSDIDKDSQQWNDMFNAILNVDSQIQDMTNNIEEFNNAIRDLDWEIFDYLEQSVSRIASESDYLIKLLENEDLFDENGNINKYGDATIGLHIASFETYKKQSEDYYKEMQELQNQIVNGAGKDVLDRYYEMVDAHQDAILAAQDEKNAILDLIEQGYQAQLDSINELISKKQEALNAEKNLYEYQKKVSEQTKNIAALEKQKTAYENFGDDEEIMSKIQQIKVQLEEAKANLEETEYDKYLSDVQMMFDEFVVEYQEWINERLDNEDALLEEIVTSVNQKGEEIGNTLNDFTSKYGTTMSDTLTSIFGSNAPFTDIISQGFGNVSDKVSGVTSAINNLIQKITDIATEKNSFDSSTVTGGSSSSGSGSSGSSNSDYSSSSSSSSGSSNGSNDYDDIFIYKKYYPQKLYPETSIIDRCKYNNFDASFEARARYYSKMGGSGSYTSSYAQNTWMIKKMKEMGYAKGTDNATKGMHWTQENGEELILRKSDGAILTPLNNGDMVLKHESTKTLYDFANNPQAFLSNMNLPALDLKLPKLPQLVNRNANNTNGVDVDIHIGQVVANDPVEFSTKLNKELASNLKTRKILQEQVLGQCFGHNFYEASKYL